MAREFIYIIKLWFTALLVSPIVQCIIDHSNSDGPFGWIFITIISLVFGTIFSAPSAFILWLATLLTFRYTRLHIWVQKAIWSVIAAGLSFLPFMLIDDVAIPAREKQEMTIIYGVMIIAGIWCYQLRPHHKVNDDHVLEEGHPVH